MHVARITVAFTAGALLVGAPVQSQAPERLMGAPYHDASRGFIDFMIPHHEMAIMMSEHASQAARTDAVRQIAQRMAAAQRREVGELRATRRALFGSDSSRTGMMRAMMQMMGMHHAREDSAMAHAMMDSMSRRQARPGQAPQRSGQLMHGMMSGDIDRMFLEHMISHHHDGNDVAVTTEHSAAAARVKDLARQIRTGQERDIADMRRLLAALPTPAPGSGHSGPHH